MSAGLSSFRSLVRPITHRSPQICTQRMVRIGRESKLQHFQFKIYNSSCAQNPKKEIQGMVTTTTNRCFSSTPHDNSHDNDGKVIDTNDLELLKETMIQTATDGANDAAAESAAIPGAQTGGKKMAIVFTCKVCNTRSAKQFTERAYNHGVVIIKCPGCSNQHLIADRLGFFEDDTWDVEMAMKNTGEKFTAVTDDNVLELTMKDVLGDKYDEALEVVGYDISSYGDVLDQDEPTTRKNASGSRHDRKPGS